MAVSKKSTEGDAPEGVAAPASAAVGGGELNQPEGVTTRDGASDLGVPMIEGDPNSEPVGPEDALGVGPKRGDYSDRIGPSNYHPHEAVRGKDGVVRQDAQRPRVEEQGDDEGRKGGTRLPE